MTPTDAKDAPIPALLLRYMKRRDVSGRELARRVERSHTAVQNLLSPSGKGTKGWQGDAILFRVARALEIPERDLFKAISDHHRNQAEESLAAAAKSARKRSSRTSKTCYRQTLPDQPQLAFAVGL